MLDLKSFIKEFIHFLKIINIYWAPKEIEKIITFRESDLLSFLSSVKAGAITRANYADQESLSITKELLYISLKAKIIIEKKSPYFPYGIDYFIQVDPSLDNPNLT